MRVIFFGVRISMNLSSEKRVFDEMVNPKKYVKTMKNVMVEMKRSERKEPNSRYTYSYFMAKQINLLNERQYTNGNVVVARKINRQRVKSE